MTRSEAPLEESLRHDGFAFASGAEMRSRLTRDRPEALADWTLFAQTWNDLRRDEYMADGRSDRLRRHAVRSRRR